MRQITINICKNAPTFIHYFDYSVDAVNAWALITGQAGWVGVIQDAGTSSSVGIIISPQATAMSDTFMIAVSQDNLSGEKVGEYEVTVNVVSECTNVSAVCCERGEGILWLNREGGIQGYYFDGVRTYEMEQGDETKYIDYNNISRISDSGKVHDALIATTKNIPQSHIDLLDSLRYSVQAWHAVNGESLPIVLDRGSYSKYKSRDKLFNASIRFIYAEAINIQSQ